MITYKYKRPTQKQYGHTKIFVNGVYVGYLILERSKARVVGQNWFVEIKGLSKGFSNRKKAVEYLKQIYRKSV